MNLFTAIQIIIVALLCYLQSTIAALAFPFVLVLLIPFRLYVLRLLFTDTELRVVGCVLYSLVVRQYSCNAYIAA